MLAAPRAVALSTQCLDLALRLTKPHRRGFSLCRLIGIPTRRRRHRVDTAVRKNIGLHLAWRGRLVRASCRCRAWLRVEWVLRSLTLGSSEGLDSRMRARVRKHKCDIPCVVMRQSSFNCSTRLPARNPEASKSINIVESQANRKSSDQRGASFAEGGRSSVP